MLWVVKKLFDPVQGLFIRRRRRIQLQLHIILPYVFSGEITDIADDGGALNSQLRMAEFTWRTTPLIYVHMRTQWVIVWVILMITGKSF